MAPIDCAAYILTVALILFVQISTYTAQTDYDYYDYDASSNIEDEIGLSTSGVLRLRGYTAKEHYVTTSDGYILQLVEASNPLVSENYSCSPDKQVVLFIHGTFINATFFITDTPGASPKDYSNKNASQEDLDKLYEGSSNSESLVLMLLDFGHKVFLLNRRGTIHSQGRINRNNYESPMEEVCISDREASRAAKALLYSTNSSTDLDPLSAYFDKLAGFFNPNYWYFSLDEEVKYDIPEIIDFILERTRCSSLAVVGWSSGGALIEMALSEQPNLNQKISKALLWSPSLYLGRSLRDKLAGFVFYPLITEYIGPILPQFVNKILSFLASTLCSIQLTKKTVCQAALDIVIGYGGDKELVKPGFFNSFPAPVSSHHMAHLAQAALKGKMHHYDYGLIKNLAVYGKSKPPLYDVSKISSTGLYFWAGGHDGLVDINDVQDNVDHLSVRAPFTKIDQPGTFFNHLGYMTNKHKSQLLLKPCLKILES